MNQDFQLGVGGPLHRLEAATRLMSARRQVAAAILVAWLPLVVFGVVGEKVLGSTEPIIHDGSVHVRLLFATPLFLILDRVFSISCRRRLEQLLADGFVPAVAEAQLERLVHRTTRMAAAAVPELLLATLALGLGIAALAGAVPIGGLVLDNTLTAAKVWYALFAWPLFQFLMWRSLWRWAAWARTLVGLAKLRLKLVPAHPDRRGGIAFLSQPSVEYCAAFLFAVSSVLSAEWGGKLALVTVESVEPFLFAFAAVSILVAFGPLFAFTPMLFRTRNVGLIESDSKATAIGRRLRSSWLERDRDAFDLRSDSEPLAHITQIHHDTVEQLVPILFYRRDALVLLLATLLPVAVTMLVHLPRGDWTGLVKLLTGGLLH